MVRSAEPAGPKASALESSSATPVGELRGNEHVDTQWFQSRWHNPHIQDVFGCVSFTLKPLYFVSGLHMFDLDDNE